jgi:hypothetical protein
MRSSCHVSLNPTSALRSWRQARARCLSRPSWAAAARVGVHVLRLAACGWLLLAAVKVKSAPSHVRVLTGPMEELPEVRLTRVAVRSTALQADTGPHAGDGRCIQLRRAFCAGAPGRQRRAIIRSMQALDGDEDDDESAEEQDGEADGERAGGAEGKPAGAGGATQGGAGEPLELSSSSGYVSEAGGAASTDDEADEEAQQARRDSGKAAGPVSTQSSRLPFCVRLWLPCACTRVGCGAPDACPGRVCSRVQAAAAEGGQGRRAGAKAAAHRCAECTTAIERHILACSSCQAHFHFDCLVQRYIRKRRFVASCGLPPLPWSVGEEVSAVHSPGCAAHRWHGDAAGHQAHAGGRFGGVPEHGRCPACGVQLSFMALLHSMKTVGWGNKARGSGRCAWRRSGSGRWSPVAELALLTCLRAMSPLRDHAHCLIQDRILI